MHQYLAHYIPERRAALRLGRFLCVSYMLTVLAQARHLALARVDHQKAVISVQDVSKSYGRLGRAAPALSGVTLIEPQPVSDDDYPGGGCGYYSFLMSERSSQEDPDHVASTWNA